MSYKAFDKLNPIDQAIRRALPDGMFDETRLTIEFQTGFEEFGTYETWGSGYSVSGYGVFAKARALDDAVAAWIARYKEQKALVVVTAV